MGCQRPCRTRVGWPPEPRPSFWIPARSFCTMLIGVGDRLVIEDAVADQRTRDHPSVRPMKIGAWAGYPIRSSAGDILGSFCVIDENRRFANRTPCSQGDIGVGALQLGSIGDGARQFLAGLAGRDDGVDDPEVEGSLQASGGGLVLRGQLRLRVMKLLRRHRSEC